MSWARLSARRLRDELSFLTIAVSNQSRKWLIYGKNPPSLSLKEVKGEGAPRFRLVLFNIFYLRVNIAK